MIGRYSEWIASTVSQQISSSHSSSSPIFAASIISVLLSASVDNNPRVQTSALASVNLLIESISTLSYDEQEYVMNEELMETLLKHIGEGFKRYNDRNRILLCDMLAGLCECEHSNMASPKHLPLYLPSVMHNFLVVQSDNRSIQLFPIMESICSVLKVIGMNSQMYAPALLARSLQISFEALKVHQEELEDQLEISSDPEKQNQADARVISGFGGYNIDFVICSLDIIGSLAESLNSNFSTLICETDSMDQLIRVLLYSLEQTSETELLQSAFALVGELVQKSFTLLIADGGAVLMKILAKIVFILRLPALPLAVHSNCLWASGEIINQMGSSEATLGFIRAMLPSIMILLHLHGQPSVTRAKECLSQPPVVMAKAAALASERHHRDNEDDDYDFEDENDNDDIGVELLPQLYLLMQNMCCVLGRIGCLSPALLVECILQPINSFIPPVVEDGSSYLKNIENIPSFHCWCR